VSIKDQIFLNEIHSKLDTDAYLKILYKDALVGNINYLTLLQNCLTKTNTVNQSFKIIRRADRLFALLKFLLYAIEKSDGPIAECGVFRGFSALAISTIVEKIRGKNSIDIYLIDSFEGLSKPVEQDWIVLDPEEKDLTKGPFMKEGFFSTPIEEVSKNFQDIKNVKFLKGWIPDTFLNLPEEKWSFVHLDVDLYKPIFASLEYFYPRMRKGGVIVNDDYGSVLFPGAGKAWREFFDQRHESYLILDNGQSVFIKE
jgi:hypothetical protein